MIFCMRGSFCVNFNHFIAVLPGLLSSSQEILQPFILGCDTKQPKIVHLSLSAIQRLIGHETVSMVLHNQILGPKKLNMILRHGPRHLQPPRIKNFYCISSILDTLKNCLYITNCQFRSAVICSHFVC